MDLRGAPLPAVVMLALACAQPAVAPTPMPPPAAASDDASTQRDVLAHTHAAQLGAASVEWRQGHAGACPLVSDLVTAYAFAPDVTIDARGAPLTIECADSEMRVLGGDHGVLASQAYKPGNPAPTPAPAPTSPSPDPGSITGASVPVSNAEQVIRSQILPRVKACYGMALQRDPTMSGTVHGTTYFHADGTVKNIVFDKATSQAFDAETLKCFAEAMKRVSASPATDGKDWSQTF